jgi:hypothetical protein
MNPIDCGWKSLFCAVLCFVTFSPSAPAATALANLSYSPDITIAIPITVNDETVLTDDRAGNVVVDELSIDALPANLAVD